MIVVILQRHSTISFILFLVARVGELFDTILSKFPKAVVLGFFIFYFLGHFPMFVMLEEIGKSKRLFVPKESTSIWSNMYFLSEMESIFL